MKEDVPRPKAYIKPEYLDGNLPDGNPFNVVRYIMVDRNTKEYRQITRMVNDFLARPGKATPITKVIY